MMAQEVLYRSGVEVESLPPEDDTAISLYMARYTQLLPGIVWRILKWVYTSIRR